MGAVALIDIGTEFVAGAYALFSETEKPVIVYATQIPVLGLSAEAPIFALEHAISALGNRLMREGGPALWKLTGSARITAILVSIDAPWQETALRSDEVQEREPFTFTKDLVTDLFERQGKREGSKIIVNRSIVGTTLNGYEVSDPYRKKTTRASILHLTSLMEEQVFGRIDEALRRLFLGARRHYISGSSLRFQAIRVAFPHEREFAVVDAAEPKSTLLLMRNGLPAAVFEARRTNARSSEEILPLFSALRKKFPLPQTIIIAGREDALEQTELALRRLQSGEKPALVPLQKRHLGRYVDALRADLGLLLLALFYQTSQHNLEDMHTDGA